MPRPSRDIKRLDLGPRAQTWSLHVNCHTCVKDVNVKVSATIAINIPGVDGELKIPGTSIYIADNRSSCCNACRQVCWIAIRLLINRIWYLETRGIYVVESWGKFWSWTVNARRIRTPRLECDWKRLVSIEWGAIHNVQRSKSGTRTTTTRQRIELHVGNHLRHSSEDRQVSNQKLDKTRTVLQQTSSSPCQEVATVSCRTWGENG